ncbi:tetratricopeptide repeat protein [Agrobacterium vitis]|uniref:Tetratricopeptide repeat protein n=1 Tax=Agrobacterium vitis TaxID=373 RepID=A0ABD6G9B3_AGRVI|nr:tetratricopeptide repeat protein [Agrobacterium vitis]MUO79142.1 tetratricopeptide repeat protein [Agrobacterium vitis]MUO95460.1 tetratricopeptide repeat protein [Agrobacterium vitis]MUP05970.1 tetratricopeptide repeat protein [Agrobacterium vitis]MUZ83054.1 tetratricopeptide repeat protein [Agrobacterium vitis]MVA11572.1 tetratricopeptide repeat protein [Agrobacterium vitis]
MRQIFAKRFLSGTALLLLVSFSGGVLPSFLAPPVAMAAETAKQPVDGFDLDEVDTLSGAYLAARTANTDRDFTTAVALYEKALRFEPQDLEIRESLMLSLLMAGRFEEGAKYATELRKDQAVERITAIVRGLDAIKGKKYRAAEKILAYKGPNDLDRLTNALLTAWAKMGAGRGKEALADLDKMKGPAWYGIFKNYNAGVMAAAIGDETKARSYLSGVITDREGGATAPDTFLRAVMALATLEAKTGNKQKALDALAAGDEVLNNYPPFKAMRERIEKGEVPKPQVATADEGAASVLFSIGGALNRQGTQDTVALYLQLSRALDPDSADTLIMLGGIAEGNKQTDLAISLYKQVPAESPMRRISEMQLGLALGETGKVEESKAHLKSLIASDPQDIRSYLAYGSVLSDAKDYTEMAANYDKAAEIIGSAPGKNQWPVFFQRGIAYERLKKWDQAEPNFRKALELNPQQPQVLNYLGYSWVDMNRNLQEGLEMIKKAVELKPDDGYIVDSLGWAYYRLGRYDEAVEELERAVQLKAGDATINDHLGDAYWRVGRKLEATFQWRQVLAFKPEPELIATVQEKLEKGLPDLPAGPGAAEVTPPVAPAPAPTPQTPDQPEKKS